MLYYCDFCGKLFKLSENQRYKLKKGLRKHAYCSRECYVKAISGGISPYWKDDVPKKATCAYCGKEFLLTKQQRTSLRKNKAKKVFCSNECRLNYIKASKPHNWKGGKYRRKDGYVMVYAPNHPYAVKGYILEHRLIMEKAIGRHLNLEEVVHHINGIRSDNRIENLMLFQNDNEHQILHGNQRKIISKYICPTCGKEFLLSKNQKYYLQIGRTNKAYCSFDCYVKSFDSRKEVQCANCGKIFMPKPSQWWKFKNSITKQVFCSRECADEFKSGRKVE
ncbi:HNH endonuclease signature motif containing protein [Caldanaerobacter sp.]|uniref:HNH endonuclease signature motif containing protein n=1 Tax=Caldanaerobacter sp. TaxID=2930036 RepID=UPI003C77F359